MYDEKLQNYLKPGKIVAKILKHVERLLRVSKKLSLYELCVEVEGMIMKLGAKPAFPCNVGVNQIAAHFSPLSENDGTLPDEGLVKVDLGVRVDGFLADAALTVPLSKEFHDISLAAKATLEEAIRRMKPGEKTGKIGEVIERTAKTRNYKTIRNLSGHLMEENILHAGKSIPNVAHPFTSSIKVGEVYAVEPFLTLPNAYGEVIDTDRYMIFQLERLKRPKGGRLESLYDRILKEYGSLPFSPRWLIGPTSLLEVLEDLNKLTRLGVVHAFPVLIERSGGYVAQFEHTVMVLKDETVVLTK